MKRGQWAATTEFKLNYLRAVKSGTLTAEATVLTMGRRSAVVRVDVSNDGKLACVAQGTLLDLRPADVEVGTAAARAGDARKTGSNAAGGRAAVRRLRASDVPRSWHPACSTTSRGA